MKFIKDTLDSKFPFPEQNDAEQQARQQQGEFHYCKSCRGGKG